MRWVNALFAVMFIGSVSLVVHAADEMAEKKSPTTRPASLRLVAPYSKMTSLTDELKLQIREIHRKALSDKREIERKEMADIAALLSDEQKKELRTLTETAAAEKKKETGAEETAEK